MKRLNRKGFTLIELLAVITIMGILMIVAIPAISRTIENSRRDMFLDTAKQYVNAVKTLWISDGLECPESNGIISDNVTTSNPAVLSSYLTDGSYYVLIDSSLAGGPNELFLDLLESGGKSAWSNKDVKGFVRVVVDGEKVEYYVSLHDGAGSTDASAHGIKYESAVGNNAVSYLNLKRKDVVTKNAASSFTMPDTTGYKICRAS